MAQYKYTVLFKAKYLSDREREKIRRHFQKKRCSGGGECGPVEAVEEGVYSISFLEERAQKEVLDRKDHVISLPCGDLPVTVSLPPRHPIRQVCNLDPYLVQFLNDSPEAARSLQNQLSSIGCTVKLQERKAVVTPVNVLSEQWQRQVDHVFAVLQDVYRCYYETNPGRFCDLIHNSTYELGNLKAYNEGDLGVFVGKSEDVERLLQTRMEHYVSETQYNLVEEEYKNELNASCPRVRMTRNGSNVILNGPKNEINLGVVKLSKMVDNIKEKEMPFPLAMLRFLKSSGAFTRYQAKFQQFPRGPVVMETRLSLVLYSLSTEALEEAATIMQSDLCVQILPLEGTVASAPVLDQLKEALTDSQNQINRGDLRVAVSYHAGPNDTTNSKIQLVGYSEDVGKLKDIVLHYREKYTIVQESVTLPHPEMVDSFNQILSFTGISCPKVKLTPSTFPSPSVCLSGPFCLVQEARRALDSALGCLTSTKLVLDGLGAPCYFLGAGKESVEQVERSWDVLLLKHDGSEGRTSGSQTNKQRSGSTQVNATHLVVKFGSLEEQQVDVLVVPMLKTQASSSPVGNCVMKKAGKQVETNFELATGGCQRSPGQVLQVTGTPALGPSKIFFIECLPWDGSLGRSVKALRTGLGTVLDLCAQQGYGSVALPVIGPGTPLDFPQREAVRVLTEEISRFGEAGTTGSVAAIHVVIKPGCPDSEQIFEDVYKGLNLTVMNWKGQAFLSCNRSPNSPDPPRPWRIDPLPPADLILSRILPTTRSRGPRCAFLILGRSMKSVSQAALDLRRLYETQCCRYSFSSEMLAGLTQKEADKLGKLINTQGLVVKQEQGPVGTGGGRERHWIVAGPKDGVHQVVQLIAKSVPGCLKRQVREKEEDEMYSRVAWCILGKGGEWVRLSKEANYSLETGDVVRGVVNAQGLQWSVDLLRMKAKDQTSGKEAKLKRLENLPGFSLPLYWDSMAPGKQLKVIALNPHSAEFERVKDDFLRGNSITVDKIERIQNKHLRQAYEVRLSHISAKNSQSRGEVEKLLYHGTQFDNCQPIIETGFDRNLARQGVLLGRGVYFAVKSRHSLKYSGAGRDGLKAMFVVRVLTGHVTQGNNNLLSTPPNSDSVADDLQNPKMFAVFNDSAAYPEYLITFH